jgi:hypothetical protein
VLKKDSRNKNEDDIPDVRADEPDKSEAKFMSGLRRVLQAGKGENRRQLRTNVRSSPHSSHKR